MSWYSQIAAMKWLKRWRFESNASSSSEWLIRLWRMWSLWRIASARASAPQSLTVVNWLYQIMELINPNFLCSVHLQPARHHRSSWNWPFISVCYLVSQFKQDSHCQPGLCQSLSQSVSFSRSMDQFVIRLVSSPKSESYSPLAVSLGQSVSQSESISKVVSSSGNHLVDQLTGELSKINHLARHSVGLTS